MSIGAEACLERSTAYSRIGARGGASQIAQSVPVIALNAHRDVVPPGESWTRDPYGAEIADGWMYGRGVAVSKSDFAKSG